MHIIQAVAHFSKDALHLFLGECPHTHMFSQCLSIDIFVDDRVAQTFDMNEIHNLADILVVEHGGSFKLPSQRSQACRIVDIFLFQSLDNDFLAMKIGGKDTAVPVLGSMEQTEVSVVV